MEDSVPLAAGLTYSLFSFVLLALANQSADVPLVAVALLLACFGMARMADPPALTWPGFSWGVRLILGLSAGLVGTYTALCLNLSPDDDFWIHYPLQGLLAADGLPVLHPFFSEIKMKGHYGRDLLVATWTRHTQISLLHSLFWQTVITQLASLATIVGLVHRSSRSELAATLAALLIFFGINVGGRGGLLDCYQNNNALAYLLTLSVLHLIYLVLSQPRPSRVITAGLALGTLALVYETHFGLVGLTLLTGMLVTRRKSFAVVGLLGLLVACLQGGPITALVQAKLSSAPERAWTPGELNQHQIIKVTFPKKELFQIQLAYGDYQRRSLVYSLLPDLGPVGAIAPGTPYRPIWSWDVLKIHWLATLLAPWTLWALLRKCGKDPVGLALWIFAAFSFLTPALVHFGPIYEFEYFRWQFAAGFGFAGALGVAAGMVLERQQRWLRGVALALLALLALAPVMVIFPPRVARYALVHGTAKDAFLPRSESDWVLAQSPQLAGFSYSDLMAAYGLRSCGEPGDRVLVNAPSSSPGDIHFESALTALSGRRSVGHALPWPNEPVGTPPFHRSAPAQAFWVAPSLELLDQMAVDWVYLRPVPSPQRAMQAWLDKHCELAWVHGGYRIYGRRHGLEPTQPAGELAGVSEDLGKLPPPQVAGLPREQLTHQLFQFELTGPDQLWAWGFVKADAPAGTVDLHEVVTGREGPSAGVTPPLPGDYDLIFFQIEGGKLRPTTARFRFRILERGSDITGM